jgi:hypothetical protein
MRPVRDLVILARRPSAPLQIERPFSGGLVNPQQPMPGLPRKGLEIAA